MGASGKGVGAPKASASSHSLPQQESLQAQVWRDISSNHGQGPGIMGPVTGLCIQLLNRYLLKIGVQVERGSQTLDPG